MSQNRDQYVPISDSEAQDAWGEDPSSLGLGRHDRQPDDDEEEPVVLATVEQKKRIWWRNVAINALFMGGWFISAMLITMYNKWMTSDDKGFGFPYPLFVTSLQMWIQFSMAAFLRYVWPATFRPKYNPTRRDYGLKAVPTAISTALDIGFSNWALRLVTVTLYTMTKSATLLFVLLFAWIFRLEVFSTRLVFVVILIFVGVILSDAADTTFVASGVALCLAASFCSGLRWSLTQLLLKNPKSGLNHPAATLFWLTPAMGVTLSILSMAIDGWGNVFATHFFEANELPKTIPLLFLPGVIAFCMVLSEYYIIQRTGALPLSIAGTFKEVSTLALAGWVFGDHLNPINMSGIGITFIGMALFTYHKYRKSIDSPVPLDGHGNPIPLERVSVERGVKLPQDDDSGHDVERRRLTSNGEIIAPTPQHVLFSAGDLTEFGENDLNGAPSIPMKTIASRQRIENDPVVRASMEIEREWSTQTPPRAG